MTATMTANGIGNDGEKRAYTDFLNLWYYLLSTNRRDSSFDNTSKPMNIQRLPMLIHAAVSAFLSGDSGRNLSSTVRAIPNAGQKIRHHFG